MVLAGDFSGKRLASVGIVWEVAWMQARSLPGSFQENWLEADLAPPSLASRTPEPEGWHCFYDRTWPRVYSFLHQRSVNNLDAWLWTCRAVLLAETTVDCHFFAREQPK